MTRLLVVRHARSEGNEQGLLSGTTDPPLSPLGHLQAEAVGRALVTSKARRIIASPMQRTVATARAIVDATGRDEAIEIDEALTEMDYGEWEGKTFEEIGGIPATSVAYSDPGFAPPGGESVNQLLRRIAERLEYYAASTAEGDTIFITHMGPAKASAIWAMGAPAYVFPRLRIDNASITTIRVIGSAGYLSALNEHSHLREVSL